MSNKIDLESLCKAALAKLGLKLVKVTNVSSSCDGILYAVDVDDAHHEQNWAMMYCAMAMSVNEFASRLFKLSSAEGAYWWPNFSCVNLDDGRIYRIKNMFAGKSLEEAQVIVDFM